MDSQIKIFTIGFCQKTAEQFFEKLMQADVKRLIDIRLNNTSQLAAYTKKTDLEYFLKKIANIEYSHVLSLAPSKEILDAYKKHNGDWALYEKQFLQLLSDRQVEKSTDPSLLHMGCFLCSEPKPTQCHRRLTAEYFKAKLPIVEIIHL